jgi:hypothetical protein
MAVLHQFAELLRELDVSLDKLAARHGVPVADHHRRKGQVLSVYHSGCCRHWKGEKVGHDPPSDENCPASHCYENDGPVKLCDLVSSVEARHDAAQGCYGEEVIPSSFASLSPCVLHYVGHFDTNLITELSTGTAAKNPKTPK